MAGTIEQKLASLGIVLQQPASPIANYVGFVRTGNLLVVSGQVCIDADGKLVAKGQSRQGRHHRARPAGRRASCAINLLRADQGRARRPRQGRARGAARRLHQLDARLPRRRGR